MQRFKYALAENWTVQPDYFSGPLDPARKPVMPVIAATAAASDESGQTSWLLCRAGTHLCAVPIGDVIEIMRVLPIDAISGAPSYVRGLCIMRGAPVPVVDIGLLVGDQPSRSGRLVAVRAGSRTIAFVVETVESIRKSLVSKHGLEKHYPHRMDVSRRTHRRYVTVLFERSVGRR